MLINFQKNKKIKKLFTTVNNFYKQKLKYFKNKKLSLKWCGFKSFLKLRTKM